MSQHANDVLVVGIGGSLRGNSHTRRAVAIALQGAAELGARTQLIDLRDYDLAFCNGEETTDKLPGIIRLRSEVKAAQGIILGTPEYHGSFSGVLKNALDLMGFDEFEGKLVGLLGVSGGMMGAVNALASLQVIVRSLHAWLVPEQAMIAHSSRAFDANGQMHNLELEARVKEVGRQVARFAFLHHSKEAHEFVRLWEAAPNNPGASNR